MPSELVHSFPIIIYAIHLPSESVVSPNITHMGSFFMPSQDEPAEDTAMKVCSSLELLSLLPLCLAVAVC